MTSLRRGIAPDLLLSQVKNTMPYLFENAGSPLSELFPSKVLRDFSDGGESGLPLSHVDYFKLCLSSHFLTCGTPVPTDVDNQIRQKLWPAQLPLEMTLEMAKLVLECRTWGYENLSTRSVQGLSGHHGEWFTVACGAYCALLQYSARNSREVQDCREALFENIADEVNHHSDVFASLWKSKDGLSCLKAAAVIAHNFGDLDRVMDMWDLSVGDPLRLQFFKLTANPLDSNRKLRYLGRLWVAGELYKTPIAGSSMALENHRHFALRKPKCLRSKPEFLIPIGPFFDEWGRRVARGLAQADGTPSNQTHEVVEALKYGWSRLPKTVGYGRALCGISDVHPEFSPSIDLHQSDFEKKWNDEALQQMDEIPSRA